MAIVTVPQLSDNYAYLVIDEAAKECAVVDCAEPDAVIAAAKSHGAKIVAVLTTHWHGDHSGGNEEIAESAKRGGSRQANSGVRVASVRPSAAVPAGRAPCR